MIVYRTLSHLSPFISGSNSHPTERQKPSIHRHNDAGDEGAGWRDQPEQRAQQAGRRAEARHRGMGHNDLDQIGQLPANGSGFSAIWV